MLSADCALLEGYTPDYRRRSRERSNSLARLFGLYFAAIGALLVMVVVAWMIAKLV